MEASSDDKSSHPASFSTVLAKGFREDSKSMLLEISSTDMGNLAKLRSLRQEHQESITQLLSFPMQLDLDGLFGLNLVFVR